MKKKNVGFATGRAGAGKGFVCEFVEKEYGIKILSMSKILDKSRNQSTPSGETIGSIMNRGEIVPVRIVLSLLEKEIESVDTDKLIVDGFPRTIEQASFLETQNEFSPTIFYIKAKRSLCVSRIINAPDRGKRADDEPEKIKIRQDIFERDTLPAIKYLESGGIAPVVTLDGRKSRELNADIIMKNLRALEISNGLVLEFMQGRVHSMQTFVHSL